MRQAGECRQHRSPSTWTSKLVALKLYTGARETAIASHFQHMACGPLARFRGRYRTLWIVRRIAFREMFVVSVSSDRQSSFKGSLGTQTQGPYLGIFGRERRKLGSLRVGHA